MPWNNLETPKLGALNAKRADPKNPFDFFYAINSENQKLLVLKFSTLVFKLVTIPKIKGVDLKWVEKENTLQIILLKEQDTDLFTLLCKDLVTYTLVGCSEKNCIDLVVFRLLKWQRFLSRGGSRLLDANEVRGLFAELTFFQNELLPRLNTFAVNAWKGPFGYPQDFSLNNKVFEIKSHLLGSPQIIRIASATQLWVESADLYLCVYQLTEVSNAGKSLGGLIEEIISSISFDLLAVEEFESKLASIGYFDLPAYREKQYIVVQSDVFAVTKNFPRIIPASLKPGIDSVSYSINFASLAPFKTQINWKEI